MSFCSALRFVVVDFWLIYETVLSKLKLISGIFFLLYLLYSSYFWNKSKMYFKMLMKLHIICVIKRGHL